MSEPPPSTPVEILSFQIRKLWREDPDEEAWELATHARTLHGQEFVATYRTDDIEIVFDEIRRLRAT